MTILRKLSNNSFYNFYEGFEKAKPNYDFGYCQPTPASGKFFQNHWTYEINDDVCGRYAAKTVE